MKRLLLTVLLLISGLAPAPAAAGPGTIRISSDTSIMDQAGRRIVVKRPFCRIIALYGAHTENLFALGHGDLLVGVSPHSDDPPAAARIQTFSYRDDPEKFLAARPDLVLSRPMIDRAYAGLLQRLERAGIVVATLQPADIDQMYVYWEALGVLVGDRAGAQALVARFRKETGGISDRIRPVEKPPRVFFESIHEKMKTFSPGSMPLFALSVLGAVNVAEDAAPSHGTNIANYGKERIMARGETIDVYLAQVGPMNPVTRRQILDEPGFEAIRAVRQGRVFLVDERLVARPTPRLAEGIRRIGRILYPQLFPGEPAPDGQPAATTDRRDDGNR